MECGRLGTSTSAGSVDMNSAGALDMSRSALEHQQTAGCPVAPTLARSAQNECRPAQANQAAPRPIKAL